MGQIENVTPFTNFKSHFSWCCMVEMSLPCSPHLKPSCPNTWGRTALYFIRMAKDKTKPAVPIRCRAMASGEL